jgi:hypothetical protein
MKKDLTLIVLIVILSVSILVIPIINAGTPHGVIGFVDNATDHTDANGATVTFRVFHSGSNYCNLTDTVGKNGNSG